MGLRRKDIWDRLMYFREVYPDVRMGLLGNINQGKPPICACGGSDILIVWLPSGPKRICMDCLSGMDLAVAVRGENV